MKPWSRVFAVVPDCHAAAGHYSSLWREHFYDGLRANVESLETPRDLDFSFGYERELDAKEAASLRSKTNARLREQLLAAQGRGHLDVVLSYARSREIDPALVAEVIAWGVPWINFYCDSVGQFDLVEPIARVASLNWFPESQSIPRYQALGRPSLCRPYALNPAALSPLPSRPVVHSLGFVGMPTANRVTILSLLQTLGCPIAIHGFGWKESQEGAFPTDSSLPVKLGRFLSQPHRFERIWRVLAWRRLQRQALGPLKADALPGFLAECRIVLGLNDARDPGGHLHSYLKLRDIEMPGYGCCYLTQDNPDLHRAFEVGAEVLAFKTIWEARDKVRFHTRHPEAARKIGEAGRRRVLREHTWRTRLDELRGALA